MKKFDFKLEPVLNYRKRVFDQVQDEFFSARNILIEAINELENIQQEEKEHKDTLKKKQKGYLDIANLVIHMRYLAHLNRMKKIKLEDVKNKENELNKVRENLIKVAKDKKILEKLKEKRLLDFTIEELKVEQKEYDETAILKYTRVGMHER